MQHNKLVRDFIPEIVRKNGDQAVTRIADDKEFWRLLKAKLQEEVSEFFQAENEEEFIDIMEVLYAILEYKQFDRNTLIQKRLTKHKERGGYSKRIILIETSATNDK